MYHLVERIHIGAVLVSFSLFQIRAFWMLRGSAMLGRRWVRIVPHVIDTVLLAAGLWLAWRLRQLPRPDPWLTAKLTGLVGYIVLGSIALKRGRTRGVRTGAYVAATTVFLYIVAVARAKHPWPFI